MAFESDFLGRDMDTDGDDEHTLAHRAAAIGDTHSLINAIKQDPNIIQQKDRDGYTPLAHAVLGTHIQALKRLVKMGADVNVQDAQGRTCLSIAAYQGWSDGVVYLLRKGARQDIVDKSGRTPLHAATYDTDTRSLLALMRRLSQDDINVGDNERMTALHWAAFHNRPDHVRQLLQSGGQPLQADIDGKTPLHWAAQNGSASCVPILAEQCRDLATTIDNCGKTAVHLAAAAGHTAILQDLARVAPTTCEAWDKDDRTPLHWAAATGHTSCVRALLNMGVTPNPADLDGITPLEYATNAGHKECIVLLRDRLGIKPNEKKRKQSQQKQTSGGFFKGLFSRKNEIDRRKASYPKETRLPQVVSIKNEQVVGNNNSVVNGANMGLPVSNKAVTAPREGGSKRWKNVHKEDSRDAGVSTPTTIKTLSSWNDNSSYTSRPSESRATHLSPLGGLRPPSISPRISHSPGLSSVDSVPKRRGELSPLRLDRMMKERFDIPVPESVQTLKHEGGPRSPTPTPQIQFNMNGKSVLPNIHTDIADLKTGRNNEIRIEKKKKHKRKRQEKEHSDTQILIASPLEHEINIYRPQDRGRVQRTPEHVSSYENKDDMDDDKDNYDEINIITDKDRKTEREVIKTLAGLELNELNHVSIR